MEQEIKSETFEVELFIHAFKYSEEFMVTTSDMSQNGYPLLGTQTVTLNVPTKDPVEAEIAMLEKKENSLIKEYKAQLHTIQQRRKDLLCLEVKGD